MRKITFVAFESHGGYCDLSLRFIADSDLKALPMRKFAAKVLYTLKIGSSKREARALDRLSAISSVAIQ